MKLLDVSHLSQLISNIGYENFIKQLVNELEANFRQWQTFKLSPRHATHYPDGVIEVMPCADNDFYAFKYVNGHPKNTRENKLCVAAVGLLSDARNGYPLLFSEMTLLTAMRTAATGVLAARYMAKHDSKRIALIGTGAQAEFLATSFATEFAIEEIRYFDIDAAAMVKFATNMKNRFAKLTPCTSIAEAVQGSDIVITATAAKQTQQLLNIDDLEAGMFILAMGGDCPGKTECNPQVLQHCRVVVEYLPQSKVEGEIQRGGDNQVIGELWQLVQGTISAREQDSDITFFDSVGFALEDFTVLKLVYDHCRQLGLGQHIDMIPSPSDPKNLFAELLTANSN